MATLRNNVDAYVTAVKPDAAHGGYADLWLDGNAAGQGRRAFLYFSPPSDFLGGRVLSATLTVFALNAWPAGSGTLTVTRVTEKWAEGGITWNNAPAVDATHAGTLALDSAVDGQQIDIDVTELFQDVADGDPYFGLRIEISADAVRRLHSSDAANADLRPSLDLQWTIPPDPPADLEPSGGKAVSPAAPVLSWEFSEENEDAAQASAQVQVATDADFASVVFDTGWELRSESEYDLAEAAGQVVNMVRNPSFEVDLTNWLQVAPSGGIINTFARSQLWAYAGVSCLHVQGTQPADSTERAYGARTAPGTSGIPIIAGKTYTLSSRVKTVDPSVARSYQQAIHWYDASGTILSQASGTEVADEGADGLRLADTFVAPANAAYAAIYVQMLTATPNDFVNFYLDAVQLEQAATVSDYADGDMAGYDWTGTPGLSTTVAGDYPAFPAIPDGETRYWRVRVADENGVESDWSDGAEFVRESKGTLTIVSPASTPIDDLSPAITWTLASRTQEAYRVRLRRLEDSGRWTTIYDTGRVTSSDRTFTLPADDEDGNRLILTGEQYRVNVRVWDGVDRIGTAGDPPWVEETFDFTYSRAGGVDPVDTLTATPHPTQPKVVLEWTRANEPDAFCLVVDGREVEAELQPADLWRAGDTYRYAYWAGPPRVDHTFEVEAVVNGKHSAGNPTAVAALNPSGIWLIDPDGDFGVSLDPSADNHTSVQIQGDPAVELNIGALESLHYPSAARRPVLRTQAIRGYEGTLSDGILASKDERDQFLELYGRVKTLRLILGDLNLRVRIHDVSAAPTGVAGDRKFEVGFSFFQTSGFFDVEGL